jgi:Lactonase, 7-bladed beta-propeller
MLKYIGWSVLGFVLLALFPGGLAGQNFVYTNNGLYSGDNNGNSVSAFSVDASGTLGELTGFGSPFPTGGDGIYGFPFSFSLYSANRIIVVNDFLYASNAASNTVSAFTIDPGTGALTAVAGSPFPTNAIDDAGHSGISLAAKPDGKFLYAGSTGFDGQSFGSITIFSRNTTTGGLAMVGAGPVSSGGPVYSLKVTPDDKFLVAALAQTSQIAVFAIQSDGTLQAVANSPFALTSGSATGVDINCAGNLLFAGGPTENIYAFNLASDGQLTAVTGSPFATGITSNQVVVLSHPDDNTLFSSDQLNNVTAFPVSGGSLTVPGATSSAGADAISPGGLTVSQDGAFLYAADTAISGPGFGGISTFDLVTSPPISFIPPIASTGLISQLHSLAAYPPNVCPPPPPPSTNLAATLQISDGPPPAFALDATLALDSSLSVDPMTQPVTIQLGDFSLTLPAGSFKTFRHGRNTGTYLFQGVIGRTTLKVQIVPLDGNEFQISAYGKHDDLSGLSSPVNVTVGIGGNSASTNVTPVVVKLRGNWRDF